MVEHTPGPWRVCDGGICAPELKGEGNVICLEPDHRMVASCEAWPANARLISAAPELLAAIEPILPIGDPAYPDNKVIPLYLNMGELRRLRGAIAKARAQTPSGDL